MKALETILPIIFWAIVVICDALILYLLFSERKRIKRALSILEKEKYEEDPDFIDVDLDGILKHQHSESIDTEPRVYRDHAGRLRFSSNGIHDPRFDPAYDPDRHGSNWDLGVDGEYFRVDYPREYNCSRNNNGTGN